MYSHCFRMSGRWDIVLAAQVCRACRTSFGLWNMCCSESQCFAESCQKLARRNSGIISRNSGVISRNSGVISRNSDVFFWTESSAGFDFEKFFNEEF